MECSYCNGLGQIYRVEGELNADESTMEFDGITAIECTECAGTGELTELSDFALEDSLFQS